MMVAGTNPSFRANTHRAASTAPLAPSRWPVMDLVELTISRSAWAPNTRRMAAVSPLSLRGVEVPWALM